MTQPHIVLAMTGASGAIYATRLLEVLLEAEQHVHLIISPAARLVLKQELELTVDLENFQLESLAGRFEGRRLPAAKGAQLTYHHHQNLMAPIASGSFLTSGMVICPCSLGTLGAVVHGTGENLIHRAASVHLKERRKLIVVPRETPLSTIQLENMRRASEAGAVVLPAMPGFYHGASSIRDLVDFIVARICDQLGIANSLMHRWGS
jgi:flavin prenyltransferase